jgi:hypothetical protein
VDAEDAATIAAVAKNRELKPETQSPAQSPDHNAERT